MISFNPNSEEETLKARDLEKQVAMDMAHGESAAFSRFTTGERKSEEVGGGTAGSGGGGGGGGVEERDWEMMVVMERGGRRREFSQR